MSIYLLELQELSVILNQPVLNNMELTKTIWINNCVKKFIWLFRFYILEEIAKDHANSSFHIFQIVEKFYHHVTICPAAVQIIYCALRLNPF